MFRIKERGPVCEEIADRALKLLIEGKFKIYTNDDLPSSLRKFNAGGSGYIEGVVLLDKWLRLLDETRGEPPYQVNLEHAIVHETQHNKGARHVSVPDAPDYYRRNTWDRECAGFVDAPR